MENDLEWQRILAKKGPPVWIGDMDDDCSSIWAGLLLRAELMDDDVWWWAVTDTETELEFDNSNETGLNPKSGESARKAAEAAARKYLGI